MPAAHPDWTWTISFKYKLADSNEHSSELAQSDAWERSVGYDSSVMGKLLVDAAEREEGVEVVRCTIVVEVEEEGVKACTDDVVARRQVNVVAILGLMIIISSCWN